MGIRCADHVTPLYPQKLALTSPIGGGRSVGIVRSRTKATERLYFIYLFIYLFVLYINIYLWSLTLREERRLRVFENRVLGRLFGPKRNEVTGMEKAA